MRVDSLIYCQLIGIILLLGTYELKLLYKTNLLADDPSFEHFTDVIKFNNSEEGIRIYIEIAVGLSLLLTIWRLINDRTFLDIISTMLSVPFTLWYWTELEPFEKLYLTNSNELFYKLVGHHIVFGLFVWSLLALSLLNSRINYTWEPVELLFVNIIAGLLIFDFSLDIPLLSDPKASLSLNYGHVTNGIGTALLEYIVPGILIAFGLITFYRLYQRNLVDYFLVILVAVAGWIFSEHILPLEDSLYHSGPSRYKQVNIAYGHFVALCIVVFYIALKLTMYLVILYLLSKPPPPKPSIIAAKTSDPASTKPSSDPATKIKKDKTNPKK